MSRYSFSLSFDVNGAVRTKRTKKDEKNDKEQGRVKPILVSFDRKENKSGLIDKMIQRKD